MVHKRLLNILTPPGLSTLLISTIAYSFVLLVQILIRLSCINNYHRRHKNPKLFYRSQFICSLSLDFDPLVMHQQSSLTTQKSKFQLYNHWLGYVATDRPNALSSQIKLLNMQSRKTENVSLSEVGML